MCTIPKYLTGEEIESMLEESENEELSGSDFDPNESSDVFFPSESETESSSNEVTADALYVSKDNTVWSSVPFSSGRLRACNVIEMRPGVTRYALNRVNEIKDAFLLYFPPQVEKIIIENSNKYGKHLDENNYVQLDTDLLHAYFGVLILAGVYKSKNENLEDLFDAAYGRPIFRAIMSKKVFLNVHKTIRFDDVISRRQQRNDDKFAPIRDLWERWAELLPMYYNPHTCVTVDEQLLGYHGRCKFRQYMPSKPEKYGIKFWLIVSAETCYVWRIQPYLGKGVNGIPEKNQGERVVLDLIEGLKGHNVTMDNFFSSQSLGQKLLEKNVTMVGTLRRNKRSIPPKLLICKNSPLYQSTFAFTKDTTLVSYISHKNKCTVVMSTMHNQPIVGIDQKKLPEIISFYNSTKGGVDTVDKMLSCYSCKRKTNRWPMAVFSNIIDISALNAFIIFNEVFPDWKPKQKHTKRKCFLHELGISLAHAYMNKRTHAPRNSSSLSLLQSITGYKDDIVEDDIPGPSSKKNNKSQKGAVKRGRCYECYHSGENKDKRTTLFCCICDKAICKDTHADNICTTCVPTKKL